MLWMCHGVDLVEDRAVKQFGDNIKNSGAFVINYSFLAEISKLFLAVFDVLPLKKKKQMLIYFTVTPLDFFT